MILFVLKKKKVKTHLNLQAMSYCIITFFTNKTEHFQNIILWSLQLNECLYFHKIYNRKNGNLLIYLFF